MVLPDVPQDCLAAVPWYPIIKQHAIKGRLVQLGQGIVSISGSVHRVPTLREALLKNASDIRIVIDDQKMCPQRRRSLSHPSRRCECAQSPSLWDARTKSVTKRPEQSQ
jgi:hypothetical protein